MHPDSAILKTARSEPVYGRLVRDVRRAIRDGSVGPGDRLPTEPELADQFGISVTSVRRGLDLLVSEQIIERKQGSGTYVQDKPSRPRLSGPRDTVAIGLPLDLCVYHPFFSEVMKGLRRQLGVHGWKTHDVHFRGQVSAPHDIMSLPVDPNAVLDELLRADEIAGGVFGADLTERLMPQFPPGFKAVAVDPTEVCPYVAYGWDVEIERGIDLLERAGARRIWVYGGPEPGAAASDRPRNADVVRHHDAEAPSFLLSEITQRAYKAAQSALSADPTIDGVLAGDDYTAQGVLDAISHLRIDVPGKLRVVALVNRASLLRSPHPITTLVADGYLKGTHLADLMHAHLTSPATAPSRLELSCTVSYR